MLMIAVFHVLSIRCRSSDSPGHMVLKFQHANRKAGNFFFHVIPGSKV